VTFAELLYDGPPRPPALVGDRQKGRVSGIFPLRARRVRRFPLGLPQRDRNCKATVRRAKRSSSPPGLPRRKQRFTSYTTMQPIYTAENTNPAFQLNWSVSLFGKIDFPPPSAWLEQLKTATEPDGVRILKFHATQANVGQFLVSTLPEASPSEIVRSLKSRWQYLIRTQHASAFRRNYYIGSIGEANCQVLDQYIAGQTSKHPMADPRVESQLPPGQAQRRAALSRLVCSRSVVVPLGQAQRKPVSGEHHAM